MLHRDNEGDHRVHYIVCIYIIWVYYYYIFKLTAPGHFPAPNNASTREHIATTYGVV